MVKIRGSGLGSGSDSRSVIRIIKCVAGGKRVTKNYALI